MNFEFISRWPAKDELYRWSETRRGGNKFIVKEGGSHEWRNMEVEEKNFVEWFDQYLK